MTMMRVPREFDERQFHEFAGAFAKAVLDCVGAGGLGPVISQPRNLTMLIKGWVIDRLPSEYVEITPYSGSERLRADGRHRFLSPIPRDVMLAAFKDAGFEWSTVTASS